MIVSILLIDRFVNKISEIWAFGGLVIKMPDTMYCNHIVPDSIVAGDLCFMSFYISPCYLSSLYCLLLNKANMSKYKLKKWIMNKKSLQKMLIIISQWHI